MKNPENSTDIPKSIKRNSREGRSTALDTKRNPLSVKKPSLVELTVSEEQLPDLDHQVIQEKFYNNFNFSKLSKEDTNRKIVLGITSANRKEGKTLVASNMAVSLARAYRQRTVLVDFNFKNPALHKVFKARIDPGISEAIQNGEVFVSQTKMDRLFLLTSGDTSSYIPNIKDTLKLRSILFTLKKAFDFVIVDMGAVLPIEQFPIHFINEIDGLLTVIDTKHTRKKQLQDIYKHADEKRFIGYIFNRVDKRD
jgi:Mrp family chromosome partitioning ATPase